MVIELLPTHAIFDLAGCCSVRQRGVSGSPQRTTVSLEYKFYNMNMVVIERYTVDSSDKSRANAQASHAFCVFPNTCGIHV